MIVFVLFEVYMWMCQSYSVQSSPIKLWWSLVFFIFYCWFYCLHKYKHTLQFIVCACLPFSSRWTKCVFFPLLLEIFDIYDRVIVKMIKNANVENFKVEVCLGFVRPSLFYFNSYNGNLDHHLLSMNVATLFLMLFINEEVMVGARGNAFNDGFYCMNVPENHWHNNMFWVIKKYQTWFRCCTIQKKKKCLTFYLYFCIIQDSSLIIDQFI